VFYKRNLNFKSKESIKKFRVQFYNQIWAVNWPPPNPISSKDREKSIRLKVVVDLQNFRVIFLPNGSNTAPYRLHLHISEKIFGLKISTCTKLNVQSK
jgi:hypothetical protein